MNHFFIGFGTILAAAALGYYVHILKVRRRMQAYQDDLDMVLYSNKYKVKGRFELK